MKLGRQTRGRRSWLPICPCTVGIVIEKAGGPDVLKLVELDDPPLGDDEVLIRIAATAVNRIDLQCRLFGSRNSFNGGLYIPGLECSGIIIAVGQGVTEWKVGDKVCALLNGAGYAEQVAVSAKMVLPVPSNVPLTHAASLPEAAHNAWKVISEAQLVRGRKLLLHECCGYVGLFVLQMAKCKGAVVYVTAETDEKLDFYKRHGADICINCKNEDLVTRVMEETRQKGIDVVVDSWAVNLEKDLKILSDWGKLLFVDLHGPKGGNLYLTAVMTKQARVQVLNRWWKTLDRAACIVDHLKKEVWPEIENGSVKPVVYETLPLSEAAAAHKLMELTDYGQDMWSVIGYFVPWLGHYACTGKVAGHVMGKILLTPDFEES
ncbi:uncharacterized protein [Coffea arabica]|uniref:Uncharacterized protein isoform X3 n=1 Tax=Coffea arabica TaxID=13443 RepID=A0ABM4VNC9_COFAR